MSDAREAERIKLATEARRIPELERARDVAMERHRDAQAELPRCTCGERVETRDAQEAKREKSRAVTALAHALKAREDLVRLFCAAERTTADAAAFHVRRLTPHARATAGELRTAESDLAIVKQRKPEDEPEATRARDTADEAAAIALNELEAAQADERRAIAALAAAIDRAMRLPDVAPAAQ